MACCENIRELDLQYYCDSIEFPLTANEDGVFQLIKENRQRVIATKTFSTGNDITFDNDFSEHDTITFKVRNPSGDIMEDVDGNDCFRITITPYKIEQ